MPPFAYLELTGFGDRSTSTRHILQLPATANLSWKQNRGTVTLWSSQTLTLLHDKLGR